MGKSATELALKNDLLRRLVRELIQHDKKKEPLKIYADDKESYFQAKYIPIHVMDGDGRETEYVGDVILLLPHVGQDGAPGPPAAGGGRGCARRQWRPEG